MMTNKFIAEQFRLMAQLLELKGANSFRVRAYNRAADVIDTYPAEIAELAQAEKLEELQEIAGIGQTLAEKLVTLVSSGSIPQLEQLKQAVPESLVELTGVAGLGPKRVWSLYQELGVQDLDGLRAVAEAGEIQELDGFGEKLEQQILADVKRAAEAAQRVLWPEAAAIVVPLLEYLNTHDSVKQLEVAGSFRRRRETVGDIDILATGDDRPAIIDHFINYPEIKSVTSRGETRSSVVLSTGMQVDLRVVQPKSFGAALQYFTGSKAHNIALRARAIAQNKKVNEYGLYQGGKQIAGDTEEGMYGELGLAYIPPELREDRGEVQAAAADELPKLIELDDIKGDFQSHTTASDGVHTLEEMAAAAQEQRLEYLGVTEHSTHIGIVDGLTEDALLERFAEIEQLNEQFAAEGKNFRLLKSAEVDILKDGSLAYSDDTLEQMDFVVIAVHSSFSLSRAAQTERVITALQHPRAHLLAHPTGRIIGRRAGYELDLEAVINAAVETNTAIELNAHPNRLDLNDVWLQRAKQAGAKIGLSSDAHSINGLAVMQFGIGQARRGWLEPTDVINTLSWSDLKATLT